LSSQIEHLVHLEHTNELATLFAMSNIHLFLSHREGFGNVAIEAAAASIPTIAYDVVGIRDSVEDGVTGIRVPFGDIAAVVRILDDAARRPVNFTAKFSAAAHWASQNFSQREVWQRYLYFYLQACS